jgi:hypothetical protein
VAASVDDLVLSIPERCGAMSGSNYAGTSLTLNQAYHPRSFQERGLSAPFTTPFLAGARLRSALTPEMCASGRTMSMSSLGASRHGRQGDAAAGKDVEQMLAPGEMEVLVPNPSGARGVYILPWSDIENVCRPTMHDVSLGQVLASRLSVTPELSPATLRQAARDVALQGLAGRPPARAAQAALDLEAIQRQATRRALLRALIAACEPVGSGPPLQPEAEMAWLEERGYDVLAMLGAKVHEPPATMLDRLECLTVAYLDIGTSAAPPAATFPRLLTEMQQMRQHLTEWSRLHAEQPQREPTLRQVASIVSAADRTMAMAQATLLAARGLLRDPQGLVLRSITHADDISSLCARTAWLLDGWEQICLLWLTAYSMQERTHTVREMATLLPVIPDEVEAWLSLPAGTSAKLNQRGAAPQASHQATPVRLPTPSLERIARNEQIRALAG